MLIYNHLLVSTKWCVERTSVYICVYIIYTCNYYYMATNYNRCNNCHNILQWYRKCDWNCFCWTIYGDLDTVIIVTRLWIITGNWSGSPIKAPCIWHIIFVIYNPSLRPGWWLMILGSTTFRLFKKWPHSLYPYCVYSALGSCIWFELIFIVFYSRSTRCGLIHSFPFFDTIIIDGLSG